MRAFSVRSVYAVFVFFFLFSSSSSSLANTATSASRYAADLYTAEPRCLWGKRDIKSFWDNGAGV